MNLYDLYQMWVTSGMGRKLIPFALALMFALGGLLAHCFDTIPGPDHQLTGDAGAP